jgi:diguanylate cyclase (GGDEF)-like protein/PAS domain S-box-containing protein
MLMELIVQLGMVVTATALGFLFLRQLPNVTALRWWFYAYGVGLAALLLELLAAPRPTTLLATFLLIGALVCGYAQVYWVARGLLSLQGNRRIWMYAPLAFGFSVLLGCTLLAVLAGPADQRLHSMLESRHLILPTICGILGFQLWTKSAGSRRETWVLSSVPLLGFAGGLLDRGAGLHVLPQVLRNVVPLGSAAWAGIGQCGVALAMAHMVHNEVRAGEAELRTSSERLRQLVDSADYGICEVDARGCLTFVNRTAAAMLATSAPSLTGVPMGEILDATDDDASAQALREFILRPAVPVRQVKARIRRADGTVISTKWSSFPTVREGNPAGAVVTLRDITQEETADRFINLRSALLEMITRNKSVEEVSSLLATAVEQRLPGLCCSVLVCEGDCFRVAAAPTLPKAFREAIDGLPCDRLIPPNHPKRKRTLHDWEGALRTLAATHGFGGTWTELLVSTANELLGTIVLNGPDVGSLSLEQGDTLREAARLAALAVENHRSLQRLLHQGHHDALTGLPNRLLFADRLKHALARAQRTGTQIALMCIDLDRFKYVNDTLGHDVGDLFLQQVSVRLAARIRASDTLARTGGDEFTAVIADIRDRHDAEKLAEALLASLRDPFEVEGHTLYGGASIGIALYPQDGTDADTLHRNADRAMYRAKAHGRNTLRSYSSDDARDAGDSMEIELHLHRAIEQGNFAVHFQPQFTCDRRLLGFEALLRFRHPKLGIVPPSRFIPIAEESGLILPIGQWVLDEVCRQIAEWQSKGMRPVRVAVNVSPLQFSRVDFSETVARALRASKVQPDLLELELTEGVLMSTGNDSARQIDLIAEMGVRLAVDDFGTGYSSLNYLHQLPIHVLKIDRSFVNKMLEPAGTRSIVEAIISLAHGLRLQTVAEGVEHEDQLAILQAAGCDLIQGYIFSQPLPAHEASRLLWQDAVAEHGAVISREPNPANGRYAISAPPTHRTRRGRS